jgi:hypothetical protein
MSGNEGILMSDHRQAISRVARSLCRGLVLAVSLSGSAAVAEEPREIAVPGEIPGTALHAEGAQIYECWADSSNQLVWRLREPIATLIEGGNSVGRHYAALHWEYVDPGTLVWEHKDGSLVKAKVVARASGRTADDLPWLKLHVTAQVANGKLYGVTHVQRINTQGGVASGSCDRAGDFRSVPYSADYIFWRAD